MSIGEASHSTLYTPHSTIYTLDSSLHTLRFTLHTFHFALSTPHSTLYTSHSTLQTGNRGNMFKTVQINFCRKVFCVTAYTYVSTSVPLTYVWAFGFVGCILFLVGGVLVIGRRDYCGDCSVFFYMEWWLRNIFRLEVWSSRSVIPFGSDANWKRYNMPAGLWSGKSWNEMEDFPLLSNS